FNYATSSDGAVVGVCCGVVLMVVTSTGLRSTGGSLSQGFRSVRSCSALLFGDRAARYVVMVWSGVDVLANFLRVVRGAVVPMVMVWSGGAELPEELENLVGLRAGECLASQDLSLLVHDADVDRLLVKVDADEVHCRAPGLGKRGNG